LTLICDRPRAPGPRPADQVHARYTPGPSQVYGRSVRGQRGPPRPGPIGHSWRVAPAGVARRPKPDDVIIHRAPAGMAPAGVHADAPPQDGAAPAGIPEATRTQSCPAITGDLPGSGQPSRSRITVAAGEASGSVNRCLRFLARAIRPHDRAHDRGRCPLYVRAQLDTVGLSWTQRDLVRLKAAARETGKTQLTGHFRRWWQVLGSNQRRLSRRFYRAPPQRVAQRSELLEHGRSAW
jgi:hypothetical protein